jgi:hypothetical protein
MRERSAPQNRLYWQVLGRVVEQTGGRWETPSQLHAALKIGTGYTETVRLLNGRRVVVPRSIAFDSMPQAEAQLYYDAAFELLAELMGCPVEELLSVPH